MSQGYLIGMDIGTQSLRVALFDTEGQLIASTAEAFDLDTPAPGWAQQDARFWWDVAVHNIRALLTQTDIDPTQILCIGVDSQMHAAVPVDIDGQVLVPAVQLWCDKRSAEIIDQTKQHLVSDDVYALVANQPVPAWQGFKIKWIQHHQPDVYAKTWKFMTGGAFISHKLTGNAAISISEASGSFLMDAQHKDWSDELVNLLDIDREKLPDIAPVTNIVGHITREAARLTKLAEGTPVTVGAADMMATLLSAGLTRTGRAVDTSGTASLMSIFTPKPTMDPRLMNLHHDMDGWISFGIIDSGGGALRWFRDKFCQEEIVQASQTGQDVYDLMSEQATRVAPGAEGVLFFPYLLGERTLGSPYSKGAFFGLSPRSNKAVLTRAIMEGITFELRRTLEIVEASGVVVEQIRVVGGGSGNPLWNQIRADIYGRPIVQLAHHQGQGGVLGMAMLAGVAVGVWPDVNTAADAIVKVDEIVEPNPANRERYDALFNVFKSLHDRLIDPSESVYHILEKSLDY